MKLRDKGSNLDLHVQSVASCRLDDPGMHVIHEPSCLCHSPTLRPWIDRSSYVEGFWSPALSCRPKKSKLKPKQYCSSLFRVEARRNLSLSGGASFTSSAFS